MPLLHMHRAGVTPMPYTIKTKTGRGRGSLAMLAGDAHEALDMVLGLAERGIEQIEIFDDSGAQYDFPQLYHIASEDALTR